MSKAIIFAGSNAPSLLPRGIIAADHFVCAADSGYDTAKKLGVNVDLVIGDFDSTDRLQDIERLPHLRLDRDKADSDTEVALKQALGRGCTEWILIGGGEGRYDHLLSIQTLFLRYLPPVAWYTRCESLYRVDDMRTFSQLTVDTTVAIVPAVSTGRSLISTKGLHWDVRDYLIDATQISLSNRCAQEEVVIRVTGDPVFFSIIAV